MNSTIHRLVCTGTPGGFECRTSITLFVSSAVLFQGCPFYDLDPNVSSSLGHRVPAAVNLLLPHSTSILLTRTKVYGYSFQRTFLNILIICCIGLTVVFLYCTYSMEQSPS